MCNSNTTAYLRLSAILTVVFVAYASLIYPGATAAFYNDTEASEENIFKAGSLDLSYEILNAANTNHTIKLVNDSSLDFFYDITVAEVPVGDSFCNNVLVSANGSAPVSVLSFTQASTSLEKATDVQVVYDFTINPIDADYSGKTCTLEFRYEAFQENFNYGEAYSDTETDSFTLFGENFGQTAAPITTGTVVLNEIYPNANNASSSPLNMEWVELYNGTGSSIDVEDWDLSEMSGVNENMISISASNTCAPSFQQGYARPYNGASTIIPAGGLLIVELCENNAMNNNGDTIRLYDAADVLIDSHAYGNTDKGKSHARIPDGGTWVDPIPSPGESNMTTVTVEDLEAEGWPDELIREVLGTESEEEAVSVISPAGGVRGGDDIPSGMPDTKEEQPDPDLIDNSEDLETELTKKDEGTEGESDENVEDKVSEDKVDDDETELHKEEVIEEDQEQVDDENAAEEEQVVLEPVEEKKEVEVEIVQEEAPEPVEVTPTVTTE